MRDQDSSAHHPHRPHCTVQVAICMLAGEPTAEPADPCGAELESIGFPNSPTSRWLLALTQAMRALAEWDGAGDPPVPESARKLEPRLGLTSGPHFPEEIWRGRILSMRDYCARTGKSPVHWVAVWSPIETRALAYLELLESREGNLRRASVQQHDASMSGEILVCGRNGSHFGEIRLSAFYDPRARWGTDAAARLYENCTRFSGRLEGEGICFEDVSFRTEDVDAISSNLSRPSRRSSRTEATVEVIKAIFPRGVPKGMTARDRNEAINAELIKRGAASVSERTIRNALSKLQPEIGKVRQCRCLPPIAVRTD